MKVIHRSDLKDTEAPYYKPDTKVSGWIPTEAYPIEVVETDDDGNIWLMLDESVIIAQTIDFDFIGTEITKHI